MSSYSSSPHPFLQFNGDTRHNQIVALLQKTPYTLHEHPASVTILDADTNLWFDVARIVKTVAFRVKNRGLVLAALCGYSQVDYKKLAAVAGVSRDKLVRLSPEEVEAALGYQLGGVSPFAFVPDTQVIVDTGVLAWPTVYCAAGRNDRTLELEPAVLVRLAGATVAAIVKAEPAAEPTDAPTAG